MHVALGFDKHYIVPVYTLLTSIFLNNKNNKIFFHAIATGLTAAEKEGIKKFVQQNKADISFYTVNEEEIKKSVIIPQGSHFTIATYYRLFFTSLIPSSVRRLIYIDCDTVVVGDLRPLYEAEIGEAPFGAVADPHPEIRTDLDIHEPGHYFNSGVLIIDTQNWAKHKVTENALEFISRYPEKIKFVDQDVLNATLKGKWQPIDSKYNVMLLDVVLQTPTKDLLKGKVIIHFTSPWKPWHCLTKNKLRSVYRHYLRRSPKRREKMYTDFKWDYKTLSAFFRIRIKEYYFDKGFDKIIPIKSWIAIKHYNY